MPVLYHDIEVSITTAAGTARVVFRTAQPYGFSYVVSLTCVNPGVAVNAYPSNLSQTGFTITTRDTTLGSQNPVASVTVYWIVRSAYNE